jgi:hypothetical protein
MDWIILLYTVTDRNIALLVPLTRIILPAELWETSCKSVDFPLTENINRAEPFLSFARTTQNVIL